MIIYEANETDFFSNGLGTLPDATSALVTEERNGEFVLDVIYPQQGLRSELLTKNRIIKADAGHELKDQRFVIKKVTPTMDNDGYIYLTVHAEHVSYITADLGVTPNLTLSGNATQALEQWQANLVGGHPDITVDSDIISEHETSLDITKATNARQVLGGVEGSILDTWGGEYKFDNLHISLRGQRGTTANTLISYGRNLLTFEQEDDITDTYTSIYPYASVGLADGNNSKLITVDGYFVDSQYVDRYPNRKLLPVDFGSEFTDYKIGSKPSESDTGIYTTETEIKKRLTELAKQYIENNRVGIPKVSTKITFADLSKTSEYAPLEQVNLCDIIPIRFEKLGIDTTIKVTRVVWNVLLDEYDSIELGDLRTTLGESISALESKTTGLANAVITAQSTADNQNSIFRTNGGTAEPVAKKTGDLWFKTDGDYQYMYQWDGAVWHEVVNTKDTDAVKRQVEQAQADLEQVRADANRISETQTESAKRLDEQMKALQAKTVDNATNVQNVIRDVAQAHTDYVNQQADISKQKADLEKTKQSLQTTSQNLDQARQDLLSNSARLNKLEVGVDGVSINVNNLNAKVDNIKIGGTNLMRNTTRDYVKFTGSGWVVGHPTSNQQAIDIATEGGETYTFSAWVKNDSSSVGRIDLEIYQWNANGENKQNGSSSDVSLWVSPGEEKRLVFTKTLLSDTTRINLHARNRDNNGTVTYLVKMAKVEKGTIVTDWSPAPEDEIERVSQLKVDLEGIKGTVANAQGDIAQIKLTENGMQQNIRDAQGNISTLQNDAKQFKQQFSDVDGNIANLSASAKNFELQMQDAQGNISTLQNDAKQFKQQFSDTNGNIATIKRNATELSEQLSSKVGNTEYQNFKTQTAKELSEKLVRTDLNGYATTAEVKLTVDGLKEQYNSVNSKIDNLKIGGVNLLNSTKTLDKMDGNVSGGLRTPPSNINKGSYNGFATSMNAGQISSVEWGVAIEPGETYTFSFYAKGKQVYAYFYGPSNYIGVDNGNTPNGDFKRDGDGLTIFNLTSEYKRYWITWKLRARTSDSQPLWKYVLLRYDSTQGPNEIWGWQLEKGTIPSDWGPSAKDVEDAISGVSKDLTNYKAVVERDYAKNSSVYIKNEVVNLTNSSRDSAVNAIKNDTNWKGLVNINTNSAFLQTADGFEKEVVKKATPLVEGGGVNLLPKTSANYSARQYDNGWSVGYLTTDNKAYDIPINGGETYTLTVTIKNDASSADNVDLEWYQWNSNNEIIANGNSGSYVAPGQEKTISFTQTMLPNATRIRPNARARGDKGAMYWWKNAKVEKGTVATPWTPAPEDLATVVSVNKVIDTADSHTQIIKDYLTDDNSQFKLLKNAVNLKVAKGDVIGQINLEAGKTLIQNQKVYLDADTVAFSNKAFIPSAAITSLDAGKITTGTLNAASVKVINLDANNITTGTLSGNNLSLNLDDGTVSFKKGKIVSSNNKLILNIDDGSLAVGDASQRQGMMFNQGKMYMYDQGYFGNSTWNGNVYDWMLEMKKHPYAVLEYSSSFSGTSGSIFGGSGANFHSTSGVAISYDKDINITASAGTTSGIFDNWNPLDGHGVFINENGIAMGAEDKLVSIVGGTSFRYGQQSIWNFKPTILVGTNLWTDNVYDHGYNVNKMISDGSNIYMQASALITDTSAAIFNVENGDVEFAIKGNDRNVIINASGHTSNGLIVKGSQNITNWLGCQDLSVRGNKNSVVQTTAGWTKINAYETAEYYFGDLGTAVTDDTSTVRIGIEPLFNETVNTGIPYQVFVTSYGEGYAWVAERGSNYFVIKSSVPNLEIGYEIKAKRKGYENVRLEIDKHMEVNKQ